MDQEYAGCNYRGVDRNKIGNECEEIILNIDSKDTYIDY